MEPISLITTALALATPYLIKTGEKFAEGVGEDIWKWIKKPFTKPDEKNLLKEFNLDRDSDKLKVALLDKLNEDHDFKQEFENAVTNAQNKLNSYYQQNINNTGNIEKQINIQDNKGNIQM
jgi:ribosomal protein L16 Arg81 hydroxylase